MVGKRKLNKIEFVSQALNEMKAKLFCFKLKSMIKL